MGEHDRVILLLTREEGLVHAVVKGARKPMSKLSAVTQPYTRALFQLYRGRNMDRVTQVALRTSHPGIMLDYKKLVYAGFLSELVSQIVPERERNDAIFDFLGRVLSALEEKEDLWPVAQWGALGILARAGFGPSFGRCAVCGAEMQGPPYFSAEDGGVVCPKCKDLCRDPGSVREISPGTARTLEILAASTGQDPTCPSVNARGKVREEAGEVLLKCVEAVLGRRPRSASLLERIEVEQYLKE
jgi:DNA repair protein RecO (recombination protein O)